jgi:hypothetical protein
MSPENGHEELDEATIRQLAQLADGSLQGWERAELEARVAYSPTLRAALERQRTAATALRGLDLQASPALRERIATATASPSRRPVRRRRFAVAGALAGAVAAAALAAVLIVPSGGGSPTVVDAARLSQGPATGPVGVDSYTPKLLSADVEGVPFPNWRREFSWRQDGTRSDELDGRTARTVFYEHDGKRVAYTIVSGRGIPAPTGSEPRTRNGVHLHSLADGGRRLVTWWRDGRTCVLSSADVGDHELIKLASWKGDGAVPF